MPFDQRQARIAEIGNVGDLVDDDPLAANLSGMDPLFQEDQIIKNGIVVPACDDNQLGVQLSGQGEGVKMDRGAVGDVLPAFHKKTSLPFPTPAWSSMTFSRVPFSSSMK